MRTTRKQFPVNLLTSGRLAFTIERAKVRRSRQVKKIAAWVERLWVDKLSYFNEETTIEIGYNCYTSKRRNTAKATAWPSFLLEQLERGQVILWPAWPLNTKPAGPTKTTVQATVWTNVWTYFLLKEEEKKPTKVSSIFLKGMTRNLGNTPFPAWLIFCFALQIGQSTIIRY